MEAEIESTWFVAYVWRMRGTKFQDNACNESRDSAEKIICSQSKVSLIIYQRQPNLRPLQRMHGECEVWKFQENSSSWNRDIAENVRCSTNKVPLITDWSQPNLSRL